MKDELIQENIHKLRQLLADFSVAMLTTLQPRDGSLHSRPMMTQVVDFDGQLWFFSRFGSLKVDEIRAGSQVNLSYADASLGRYVSVSGTAYIEHDRSLMQTQWSELYRAWFPLGIDEPDLALLRVEVHQAEVWDSASHRNGDTLRLTQ